MSKAIVRAVAAVGVLTIMTGLAACSSGSGESGGGAQGGKARISLVIPGPNDYFTPWKQAAADASKKLGDDVTYNVPASDEFNLTQQNALVDSLAAKGYNGFGFFPGDASGTNAEQQKLKSRGIPSININACTQDPGPSLFCISTDVYAAAQYQAEQLISAIGGTGNIAVLTSQLTDPNTQLRIKAVKDVVTKTGGKVKLAQVVADIDSPQSAPPAINALLASQGSTLAGVMSTSYNPSVAMATALTDNPQFRKIIFIGAENAPQVMDALDKGYVYGTLFQNTYGMAYAAAYALHKVIDDGCTVSPNGPFSKNAQTKKLLPSDVLIVTKKNAAQFAGKPESLPDDTAKLLSTIDDKVLVCK